MRPFPSSKPDPGCSDVERNERGRKKPHGRTVLPELLGIEQHEKTVSAQRSVNGKRLCR
jgi:hypothetical protein